MKIPFLNLKKINQPYLSKFSLITEKFIDKGWYILGDGVREFEKHFRINF